MRRQEVTYLSFLPQELAHGEKVKYITWSVLKISLLWPNKQQKSLVI